MDFSFITSNGSTFGDYGLLVLFTVSALITYLRAAFQTGLSRLLYWRLAHAIGLTIVSMRMGITMLYYELDVFVSPMAQIGLTLCLGSYIAIQCKALMMIKAISFAGVKCYRDPDHECAREDRIVEAMIRIQREVFKKGDDK